MNFLSFPRIGLKHLKFLSLFLLTPLFLSLMFFSQTAMAQQSQLTLVDIITVLRSKKVTPAEKNQLLTEGVKQRGVTFALNADLEKELRIAGADETLIAVIREKGPVLKVSATPQPKVEAVPVSTPKPPDFAFYQNRANANFVMGEYDAAIVDYNKAVELNPKEPTIYFSRALAYFNNKSFNPAIADFDKVIELDPKEGMAYFKRGAALEKIGNFEKALSDYQKAVELDADNEPAKTALQRLQAALPKPAPTTTTPNTAVVQNKEKEKEPQPKQTNTPAQTISSNEPANFGALNRFASRLALPMYPPVERQRNTEGLVTVEVTLDEEGKVTSAKAISGPRGLRQPAEDAVRKSKFNPVVVDNKAVKATGFINFNFKVK
ncbi:MAG TPA: TonB family protein [Pyrinomonadaceae bacterium]|jgi:TonB family protein|nr:TonB family protein [Pyrinomonadaceae bacterium]